MSHVDKALWYIESRCSDDLSLGVIAAHAGVSKYYLLRAFAAATGMSIMRYVRGRRLSEAARRLVTGEQDILTVALESGYGSHEAFTRAFRDQFGLTPETLRAEGTLERLVLVDAIATGDRQLPQLAAPRFETVDSQLIAGINQHYTGIEAGAAIPAQWSEFETHRGRIRDAIGNTLFGVCFNIDDEGSMDYLAGIEVVSFARLPKEFSRLRLAAQRYVVFRHAEHIAAIRATWNAIWNDWLPKSGHEVADAPLFERYPASFDWQTGQGGVELWIPLATSRAQA